MAVGLNEWNWRNEIHTTVPVPNIHPIHTGTYMVHTIHTYIHTFIHTYYIHYIHVHEGRDEAMASTCRGVTAGFRTRLVQHDWDLPQKVK